MNGSILGLVLIGSGLIVALQAARDARGFTYRLGDTSLVDMLGPDGARTVDLSLATLVFALGVLLATGLAS